MTMDNLLPFTDSISASARPLVISGPCSAESREQVLTTAEGLAAAGVPIFRAGIWKPRTKPGCFEGVGAVGLDWLREVRKKFGMLTATEVANRDHVEAAVRAGVDILWIGARTTTNPFAVQEIADSLKSLDATDIPLLIKNPVNPDLELWIGAIERMLNAGIRRLAAVHRGFSTYSPGIYRNAPIWHVALDLRRRMPGLPLICDPSHIGGRRDLVEPLARRAVDMGFDGLIIESHCQPDCALSDSRQQITPAELAALLASLSPRSSRADSQTVSDEMTRLRSRIDELDSMLLDTLSRRMEVSREIGRYKSANRIAVVQADRYASIMEERLADARTKDLDSDFIRRIFSTIHEESVRQQLTDRDADKT